MTKTFLFVFTALMVAALLFFAIQPESEITLETPLPVTAEPDQLTGQSLAAHGNAEEQRETFVTAASAETHTLDDEVDYFKKAVNNYVPGYFVAPEHLQMAVYQAVNEPRSNFIGYVDNMECVSGNCSIVVRVTTVSGLMMKAADLMASINKQFEDGSLTEGIIVGLVSVRPDENGEGLIEFVTMEKPVSEDHEQD